MPRVSAIQLQRELQKQQKEANDRRRQQRAGARVAAGAPGSDICYYNGLMFSKGSEILAPDGNILVCQNGEWIKTPNQSERAVLPEGTHQLTLSRADLQERPRATIKIQK